MKIELNPFKIKTIESNTPIRITMDDGTEYTAYCFEFTNKTTYESVDEDKEYRVEVTE